MGERTKERTEYRGIQLSGKYKHFKGGIYFVVGFATHTETGEDLVLYVSNDSATINARPINMFLETVEVDGKAVKRFEYQGQVV